MAQDSHRIQPCAQVVRPDLSNFEEQDNNAWPYLIDDFVEWKRGKPAV